MASVYAINLKDETVLQIKLTLLNLSDHFTRKIMLSTSYDICLNLTELKTECIYFTTYSPITQLIFNTMLLCAPLQNPIKFSGNSEVKPRTLVVLSRLTSSTIRH